MLTIRDVHKEYRTGDLVQKALDGVSLSFREKEFVAILGPSGSGKTTLLNVIGGLDRYDSGEMTIRGVPTSRYSDRDWDTYRNHTIGFIFQNYHLIPHQTLKSNVELALTLTGVGREERERRALEALERVGLRDQAHKKPAQLSGGQMQRVAIARALVNNPSILLADEPTGALDSETGEQVMQLLHEVSEDHLVIMVTHNPELAERYASRIVRVKDGKILEDTDPYTEKEEEQERAAQPGEKRRQKKPSMSFLTALGLSVSNLLSKLTRTVLVAFAASIGIVGIALILSLSSGADAYIHQMERDSLSQYPVEITTSAFSMEETMMTLAQLRSEEGAKSSGEVRESQMMGGMLSSARVNDLKSLKRWLDSGASGMEEYTRGIDYRYGISPQVYRLDSDTEYHQVNPDQTMAAMGVSMDGSLSSIMTGYGFNEMFRPLPANPALYEPDYELLAGTWPKKDTDCVVVLTGSGNIPDLMLYTMGLKNQDELQAQITNMKTGEVTGTQKIERSGIYDPSDFVGITFRLLKAFERYEYSQQLGVWIDQSGDEEYMLSRLKTAEPMEIVGVVKPKEGVTFGILEFGIEFPQSLLTRIMQEAGESGIVKAQTEDPEKDVLTGLPFGSQADDSFSFFTDMITVHPENISDAVKIRWDRLDELGNENTRLTATRLVKITRELRRNGDSQTLRDMIQAMIPEAMKLLEIDESGLRDVISLDMDEQHMQEIYAARAAAASATYAGNMNRFGYAEPDTPLRVTIYPSDFESKEGVLALLDAYNEVMREDGMDEKVIQYTDYVGALMSSVTTIIDVITYVLIAFVAVSLVVSSIMIGIITYISVLERRREIGILRAMGASKRNITQVFNAETFIIGLLSGAFGILLTLLFQIPINQIIRNLAGQDGIRAFLPAGAGAILVLLCIFLTYVGGMIPSRHAARQDPVAALRSE